MSFFAPAPEPPSKLGYYRVLSSRAGVRVSPLCLGAMSIGDKWSQVMGSMDKESSFQLLDAYFDLGGNFIDTANNYQEGSSEEFIGEWSEKRGIRDQLVIATKYSMAFKSDIAQKVNYLGNNTKSMHLSLQASLTKLRTSYIDIFYVHYWDYETSIEEVMDSLHALVISGKVLYLGISDTPAWIVAEANRYAKERGKTPFTVYQGRWNVLDRDMEREIIPMAIKYGMAIVPWSVLAGGKLRTDAEEQRRKDTGEGGRKFGPWERNELEIRVSHALEKVAGELGTKSITSVAIAYVMQKAPYVFPVIGGRKIDQLKDNLEALDISLSAEQMKYLDDAKPFDFGFPVNFVGDGSSYPAFMAMSAHMTKLPALQPIKP